VEGALSEDNKEDEDVTINDESETPLVKYNSPPVGTPPPSVTTPFSPASTSPPLDGDNVLDNPQRI